jgi:hypothetical protein
MVKDVILRGKISKQYRSNIDVRTSREYMPTVEAVNIANHLHHEFGGNYLIKGWFKTKVMWEDMDKGLSVIVKTAIHSDAPYTLKFNAKVKYPESSGEKGREVMSSLAAYDYHTMRGSRPKHPK